MPLTCPTPVQDIDKQYVGFATLPNQVHRKSVKKGFDFTLMVAGECTRPQRGQGRGQPGSVWGLGLTSPLHLWAGESGLGKSTLVHSLFLTDLYKERKLLSAEGEWAPRPLLGDPFKGPFQVHP